MMFLPFGAAASDNTAAGDILPVYSSTSAMETAEFSGNTTLVVEYVLDKEGRPYIVSVFSEDPQTSRMILQKMGGDASAYSALKGPLAITFYYENIR